MTRDNLAFLDSLLSARNGLYRESKWLVSDFDDDTWHFDMSAANVGRFSLDFNVNLSNRTVLTDKSNRRLLNTFKYWINASIHTDNTRGRGFAYADVTARNIIIKVVNLIDYFLLNDRYLGISQCGLQAITEDQLKCFADHQTRDKRIAEHVYGWTEKLSGFLSDQVTDSGSDQWAQIPVCDGVDFAATTENQLEQNALLIPDELIPRVRHWLWANGYYRAAQSGEFKYVVDTARLSEVLYGSTTLRGVASVKPSPVILNLSGCDQRASTEYPRVPVTREDDEAISFTGIQNYRTALKALTLLKDEALSDEELLVPPIEVINAHLGYSPDSFASDRFTTLPSHVVLDSVKNAIKFHLQNAEALVFSLRGLLVKMQEKLAQAKPGARTSVQKLITPKEFSALLHPQLQAMGVEKWTVSKEVHYFVALRSNKGLGELIRIYYGAVQIVIGALMARRQTEIVNLKTYSCLDETKRYLIFGKAKSTKLLSGRRVQVARPIDEIAVEMIERLIEIHEMYLEMGLTHETGHLFDYVSLQTPTKMLLVLRNHHGYAQNFDLFCDYFETPLRDGKRFYIRTHQLRRFFALSFFWGSGFGGMDTLRWFMGHTDLQHLYHYITESTPGEVLRHVKSQFLAETLNDHAELRDLIHNRYGTADFTLLSSSDLEEYIEDLIHTGEVDIEPEFLEDDKGQSYRLLVKIRDKHDD